MESVVVIAPCPYDEQIGARLARVFGSALQGTTQWTVAEAGARVHVARNDLVRGELEADELAQITSVVGEPVFYTVDFADIHLCRKVLEALVDDPRLLVDNDHGVRLPGPAFLRLLRILPEWDWRVGRV